MKALDGRRIPWDFGAWALTMLASSIALSVTLKTLFGRHRFKGAFLLTAIHFFVVGVAGYMLVRLSGGQMRPKGEKQWETISWVLSIAIFTCSEIILSNLSYQSCSISFMALLKSSSPVVMYLLSVQIGVEDYDKRVLMCLGFFVLSAVMAMSNPLAISHYFGVVALIGSLFSNAFRWLTIQLYMTQKGANAFQLMALVGPMAGCLMYPAIEWKDVPRMTSKSFWEWKDYWTLGGLVRTTNHAATSSTPMMSQHNLVFVSAILAIVLTLSGYKTVKCSSSATLAVIGQMKTVFTVGCGALMFSEEFTIRGWIGLFMHCCTFAFYTRLRIPDIASMYVPIEERPVIEVATADYDAGDFFSSDSEHEEVPVWGTLDKGSIEAGRREKERMNKQEQLRRQREKAKHRPLDNTPVPPVAPPPGHRVTPIVSGPGGRASKPPPMMVGANAADHTL